MMVGEFAGKPVQDAKALVKEAMIASKDAVTYYEPESKCVSRSGDECVVAMCDQWLIKYGEKQVVEKIKAHMNSENFTCFNDTVKSMVTEGVEWLKDWGSSRLFGLGSRIPWDRQYLIESLSDSTAYMAYYTVAHFLQGDLEGKKPGSLGIKVEDIKHSDWNFIFLGKERDPESKIPLEKLQQMRESFEYWYPVDIRCSAKDLVRNHLTMSLFNHDFIWGDSGKNMLPRAYFVNGYMLVEGEKMSKQKGNFVLLKDMVDKYGADASRILLANCGDNVSDANAVMEEANQAILKITNFESWLKEIKKNFSTFRHDSPKEVEFVDQYFENQTKIHIQNADQKYEGLVMRDVIVELFSNLISLKDDYKLDCANFGMHSNLIKNYIKYVLISLYPIIPHFCEIMWEENFLPILSDEEKKTVPDRLWNAKYPTFEPGSIDHVVVMKHHTISKLSSAISSGYEKHLQKKKDTKVKQIYVVVSNGYKDWQKKSLEILAKSLDSDFKDKIKEAFANDKKIMGAALGFADFMHKEFKMTHSKDLFNTELPYDEKEFLEKNLRIISRDIKDTPITIISSEEAKKSANKNVVQASESTKPSMPAIVLDF